MANPAWALHFWTISASFWRTPDFGEVMIGTILATLPTLAVFFVLQRRFVEGMLGSVK